MASVTAEAIRQKIGLLRLSICGGKLPHERLQLLVLVMGTIAPAARESIVPENLPLRRSRNRKEESKRA